MIDAGSAKSREAAPEAVGRLLRKPQDQVSGEREPPAREDSEGLTGSSGIVAATHSSKLPILEGLHADRDPCNTGGKPGIPACHRDVFRIRFQSHLGFRID